MGGLFCLYGTPFFGLAPPPYENFCRRPCLLRSQSFSIFLLSPKQEIDSHPMIQSLSLILSTLKILSSILITIIVEDRIFRNTFDCIVVVCEVYLLYIVTASGHVIGCTVSTCDIIGATKTRCTRGDARSFFLYSQNVFVCTKRNFL